MDRFPATDGAAPAAGLPLGRDEVRAVVEGRGAARRIPVLLHFWTRPERFGRRSGEVRALLERYPQDAQVLLLHMPGVCEGPPGDPAYRWVGIDEPVPSGPVAIDSRAPLREWGMLDELLPRFPDPHHRTVLADPQPADGRYRVAGWLSLLFERHWSLRGMSDALMDFTTNPREVHRLYRALTDFYLVLIERARKELDADGILTTDDLGTQGGPFFRAETFREFLAPYYGELFARAHRFGMHFWLHSCGNIASFLPDLIGLGLDVIHPLQRHAMDERALAALVGGRTCVWAGVDVQQTIPFGTPEEVRAEVRRLLDAWRRPEGRLLLGAGNMLHEDCGSANLAALFDEAYR